VHSFRFVTDFAHSSTDILALAREFDLIPSWNWSVVDAAVLAARGRVDMDVAFVLYMPWPFANRRAAVRLDGANCLDEDGSMTVAMASVDVDAVHAVAAPCCA
jgi:hypothetical protein